MDYPFLRKNKYNVSNNWWFLPTDLFQTEQDKENATKTLRQSPLLSYLDDMTRRDKFKYLVIALIIILFIYRLNLHWSIWIGLPLGLLFVYYLNERQAQTLNREGDRLWVILKSPLLKHTKYFVTDPPMIQWVDEMSEYKKYNILEFDKMIESMDRMLKLMYDMKIGVYRCKENLDLICDLKVKSLNQCHSLIYKITNADLRAKFNQLFTQLGHLLNERHAQLVNICREFYQMKPVNIDTHFDITQMDEPTPDSPFNEEHYNFYN